MKTTPMLLGLLAASLALVPAASANPGPHVTVIADPNPVIGCRTGPRHLPLGEVTLDISSTCVVTADYQGNTFVAYCAPKTVNPTPLLSVSLNYDCSVVVHIRT